MTDFEFHIVQMQEKLQEFIVLAKEDAASNYEVAKDNWNQKVRELEGEVAAWKQSNDKWAATAALAEEKYEELRKKLSTLV